MKNKIRPEYEDKADWFEQLRDEGVHIKCFNFWKHNKMSVENPPNRDKLLDKVIELLKNTGIFKLEITFANKNLGGKE